MSDEIELTEEQIEKFDRLMSQYNDYTCDKFIEHLEESEYYQENFIHLKGKKWTDMMDFLIGIHSHGIFGGLLINELGETKKSLKFISKKKRKNK